MRYFVFFLLVTALSVIPFFAFPQQKDYAYVSLDTVYIMHDTLDWSLVFYIPHNCRVSFVDKRPDSNDTKTALSVACAFTAQNLTSVVGDYVCSGNLVENTADKETGYCYISPSELIIKSLSDSSDFYKKLAQEHKASYFQQMLLLKDGDTVECTVFRKQKPTFRRCLAIYNNRGVVIESVDRLTFEDFANAVKSVGIKDAIYLDMGTWSDGFVRLKNGDLFSIGHLKYNTKHQTNWLTYIYQEPSKVRTTAIRNSNKRRPKRR